MSICQKLEMASVVIVSHIFATGPSQELEEYLKEKVNFLIFIGHPFSYAMEKNSFYKVYKNGKLVEEKKAFSWKLPDIFLYFKDIFYTFVWVMSFSTKFDLYIGADPLNAFSGIILKKFGKVSKVIFYSVDYTPKRFDNRLLNWIYHKIDSFCIVKSDYVWNLSEKMIQARKLKGVNRTDQLVVPVGAYLDHDYSNKRKENVLVYLGHLRKGQGLELVLESFPKLISSFPDIRLIIIGTGERERYLITKAEYLGIKEKLTFLGYIDDHKKVERIIRTAKVGLAIYEPLPNSFTFFADVSKPKQYMSCGLPTIITRVPPIAQEVEKNKLGIVINYDSEELVMAIEKLLLDENFYNECRLNSIKYIANFSWKEIFGRVFANIGIGRE